VAAIDKLKPADSRREIADAGKPGLYLVIQPSGRKSWAVRYRYKGQSRKLTFEGFPSLPKARELAQEALGALADGKDPASLKKAARNTPSDRIEDVFADFMTKRVKEKRLGRPIRESSKVETARLLGLKRDPDGNWIARVPKAGVLKHWSGRDVLSITRRDVIHVLDSRVAEGAPVGANRTLAALKTFFGWCVGRDIVPTSPCDHIDDPSPEGRVERTLSDAEIVAMWRAAEELGFPYGNMAQLLAIVGQRRDEVRKAVWPEFTLSDAMWKVPGARTKNGYEHHIPLSDLALKIIKGLPRIKSKGGWLFTITADVAVSNLARRKRRLDEAMLRHLRKADPDATLTPWRLHDLRHTFKTWMQKERIPKDVRNAVQNHWAGDMDEHYGHHTYEKEKRDALDRWARYVESLLSGQAETNVIPL
jgi:integrase